MWCDAVGAEADTGGELYACIIADSAKPELQSALEVSITHNTNGMKGSQLIIPMA